MAITNKPTKKQYQEIWDEFRLNIQKSTPVDLDESHDAQKKRIKKLEANPQAWKEWYFPKYYSSPAASFHKKASTRLISNFLEHRHWYEVRHWARGLAKSTLTMMDVLYLVLTGKLKNILLTSSTYDAAESFLMKYMCQLDSNARIIHDYGIQEKHGSWAAGEFVTKADVKFKALGAGNTPRGTSNEEFRPDCIIVDDFDTDEECRNVAIIDKKWQWFNDALIFTVDIANPYLIIWLGNRIAKDCCIVRAGAMANHTETINIRDKNGVSVWPEKNTEEDIDRMIRQVPLTSAEKEFFNNPIVGGKIFKEIKWGTVPPLNKFPFLVQYGDPATSNKDKGKGMSKASNKVVVLMGFIHPFYYVISAFIDQVTHDTFVEWFYANELRVNKKAQLFSFIENNSLQDPFYEAVFKPMFFEKAKRYNLMPSIIPDVDPKPNKFVRVEGNLEPLNRNGFLIFNADEDCNPHMKLLAEQLLAVEPEFVQDGPDALCGAVVKTNSKISMTNGIHLFAKPENKKKY